MDDSFTCTRQLKGVLFICVRQWKRMGSSATLSHLREAVLLNGEGKDVSP
ncbi:hypothetical protein DEO72_LG10g2531 [Vigna unguiculata]|uniref:Uncharacterized protein n=1 Tax=Vigna unguiculata TaxID=3917 RepID=A0A4D6ND93_VIGUN|nr:hypothetical protein DEO72_LG10g2531 [Vigna unguiculata]